MPIKDIPLTEVIFYILLALRTPRHGYAIIQDVSALTRGRVVLGAGTLYGALKTLEQKKWIEVTCVDPGSRKKKEYRLTPCGRQVFEDERARLKEALENAELMEKCEHD